METDKPLIIFGRDVRKVVCFRDTFLYGISSGIVTGLTVFMFTSKPTLAMHSGFGAYLTIGLGYWIQCRVRHINAMFHEGQMQDVMEKSVVLQGTEEIDEDYLKRHFKDA